MVNKIPNESETARVGFFKAHLQHYFMLKFCNKNKLLHHYFKQFWTCLEYNAIKTKCFPNKFLSFKKMMQSKQIIASLFSNSFESVLKVTQSKQIIASLIDAYKTSFYLFKRWWNQNWLLHHCFQTVLKYDAINTNYCITIFKQFWTCFKCDAITFGPVRKVMQWN